MFIVLEECYREDAYSYENILLKCADENLYKIVSQTILNGEFADNSERIVKDGIRFIKQNILQKQKDKIIGRLRLLHGEKSIDTDKVIKELMEQKKSIDMELTNLKGKMYD